MHLMRLPAVRDAWDEDISLSPLSPTGTHQPRATFAFSLRSTAWGFSTSLCLSFPTAKLDQSRGWRGWAGDTGLGVREGATGEGRIIRIFVLPVLQSFNVLTCSKMKVWKFAAIASMLLSSMLSILVCRDMFNGSRTYSPLPSSLSSRASSSSLPAAPRRPPRALPRHSSLLAQCKLLRPRPGCSTPAEAVFSSPEAEPIDTTVPSGVHPGVLTLLPPFPLLLLHLRVTSV